MKLTVVIVSYNVKHFLVQCIDSVVRATKEIPTEIVVVDNVSSDDSVAYAKQFFPQVKYIQNTENVGFAKANNQAIRLSKSEYVLLLNPDTIVAEETIAACIYFLDKNPQAAATGTRMLNRNGSFAFESRRSIPTPLTAFYKMMGLCHLFPYHRSFGRYYLRYLDVNKSSKIEIMSGAYMMLRRKALEEVGLLSEDYFMYGEDIDLSYQLLNHGWENWYQPEPILHYKGESTTKDSIRYVHAFYNAMIIFFNKHFVKKYWLGALIIHLAVIVKGVLEFFRQKSHIYKEKMKNNQEHNKVPENLVFFGTDKAFSRIQERCEKAGLCIEKAPTDMKNCMYVVYQTDEGVNTYSNILHHMMQGAEQKLQAHLGTYSSRTDTLILPNDIL